MNNRRVWVVEMLVDGQWQACSSAEIDRVTAENRLDEFARKNHDDRFRLRRYRPVVDRPKSLNRPWP